MATAVKRDGKWRIRVYVGKENGKNVYKSFTADGKKEVEQLAKAYLVDKERAQKPENLTVGEMLDKYIEVRSNVLSPASTATYRSLRRNAFPSIIDTSIGQLTQEAVQKAINDYAGGHSAKSTSNVNAFLMSALDVYYPSANFRIDLPKKTRKEITIPTDEDVDMLISASVGTKLYLPIMLASKLGLRRSEICALTLDDFDLKKKIVRINKALVRDEFGCYVLKSTKTYLSTRVLRLPQTIIKALPKENPIVTATPNQITDGFESLCKRMNMPQYTFHSLRHYNASVMLKLGVPDKYAMERMGHATPNMLKTVYQHTFSSEQDKIADTVNKYFDK